MGKNQNVYEDIQRNLSDILKTSNNSIYSLSQKTTLSRTTITEIVKGMEHTGNLASYVDLADALDIPVYVLFTPNREGANDVCPEFLVEALKENWGKMNSVQQKILMDFIYKVYSDEEPDK